MGVKEIFEKHFPYKDTKYVYDDNIVDEDNKTVSFEDYGDLPDMDQRLKDFTKDLENEGYKLNVLKGEDYPFTDEENEDIYEAMYGSGDRDYTDFYLSKYPETRDKDGYVDYKYSTPELGKEYMKQHPELWKQTREWLDTNKEVEEREEKKFQEQLKKLKNQADTNDNGKVEVDEMADFQKSLDDYATKNKKGRDDIPVTTRR